MTYVSHAIIVDIDMTLALLNGRDPYNASSADQDELNIHVADMVQCYQHHHPDHQTLLITGRPTSYKAPTEAFLTKHDIIYHQLFMRDPYDWRGDDIYKREVYENHIKDRFTIHAVFEDRLACCRMWHSLGLPLFRIGDPEATF